MTRKLNESKPTKRFLRSEVPLLGAWVDEDSLRCREARCHQVGQALSAARFQWHSMREKRLTSSQSRWVTPLPQSSFLGVQHTSLIHSPVWFKKSKSSNPSLVHCFCSVRICTQLSRIAEPKLLKTIGRPRFVMGQNLLWSFFWLSFALHFRRRLVIAVDMKAFQRARSGAFEPMMKEHNWYHKRGSDVHWSCDCDPFFALVQLFECSTNVKLLRLRRTKMNCFYLPCYSQAIPALNPVWMWLRSSQLTLLNTRLSLHLWVAILIWKRFQ